MALTLTPGARLGPYEVVGSTPDVRMEAVYRARDTRLDRTVAVQVLPSPLPVDEERRRRFEWEALEVSSLNHPHICAVYEVGQHEGIDYLVMESPEGETLADRLTRGPLPTDQLLSYGIEIADALDRAHRRGIFHGDLAPPKVLLTQSGAKLLGFGQAKLREAVVYGAPEQLAGKDADARSDIFALGALLYEMATGRPPFAGASPSALIAAVRHEEPPPIATAKPMAPPALDRVVRVCLAKDPDERLQTAHDVMQELTWIAEAGAHDGTAQIALRRAGNERLLWAGLTLALLLGLVYSSGAFRRPAAARRTVRFSLSAAGLGTSLDGAALALSPNGKHLVFATAEPGKTTPLWLRSLASLEFRALAGSEGAGFPFWAPDSRAIAFFADGQLKRIDLAGGPPRILADAHEAFGGSWSRSGDIVFAPDSLSGLSVVPSVGGATTLLTTLDAGRGDTAHRWPHFLPDGQHYLYVVEGKQERRAGLYVGSLASKEARRLTPVASRTIYAGTGHLLFARQGSLLARRFDLARLEVGDDPIAVASDLSDHDFVAFCASDEGTLAYRGSGIEPAIVVVLDWAAGAAR